MTMGKPAWKTLLSRLRPKSKKAKNRSGGAHRLAKFDRIGRVRKT